MNYVIYHNGNGFFESMGWNGITFTKDFNKAFQFTNIGAAKNAMEAMEGDKVLLAVKD